MTEFRLSHISVSPKTASLIFGKRNARLVMRNKKHFKFSCLYLCIPYKTLTRPKLMCFVLLQ